MVYERVKNFMLLLFLTWVSRMPDRRISYLKQERLEYLRRKSREVSAGHSERKIHYETDRRSPIYFYFGKFFTLFERDPFLKYVR